MAVPAPHRVDKPASPEWLRIALERQLPKPRFPAGLAVPSAVGLVATVLVAIVGGLVLAGFGTGRPAAVIDSQSDLVGNLVRGLNVATSRAADQAAELADRYNATPGQDLTTLLAAPTTTTPSWLGVSIVDPTTLLPIASSGLSTPTGQLLPEGAESASTAYIDTDGAVRLLTVRRLLDGRLLVTTSSLALRSLRLNPQARQSVLLIVGGEIAATQGTGVGLTDGVGPLLQRTLTRAVTTSRTTAAWDRSARDANDRADGTVPVVAVAPVGLTGAAVVSVVHTAADDGSDWAGAAIAASVLLLIALMSFVVVRLFLVDELRALHEAVISYAVRGRPPRGPRPRFREGRRIMAALEHLMHGSAYGQNLDPRRRYGGYPAVLPMLPGALAMIVWAVLVVSTLGSGAAAVPQQVLTDSHNQVESVVGSMRDTLEQGLIQATKAATLTGDALDERLGHLAASDRYRSVYRLDSTGDVGLRHGREPLRGAAPQGEKGILVDPASTRAPAVYAFARSADGSAVVVEFDVRYLISILDRLHGHARVADQELRTLLDTRGYVAFQSITGGVGVREYASAVALTATGTTRSGTGAVDGQDSVIVAAPVTGVDETTALHWVVVADRPVSDFNLRANRIRQGAWLAGLLVLSLGLLWVGWPYVAVIRPLRRLERDVTRAAAGERSIPITPQRHDEIGAIALCVDVCRQSSLSDGDRLAGAVRLRGAGTDYTMVMPEMRTRRPHRRRLR